MSEYPNSGLHPDSDTLSAFAEGVLPEHERLACLTHLGSCSPCREVAFLAQEETAPEPFAQPTPFWKRWLTPVPALATAMAAVLVGVLVLYQLRKPPVELPSTVARAKAPMAAQPEQPVLPEPQAKARIMSMPRKIAPQSQPLQPGAVANSALSAAPRPATLPPAIVETADAAAPAAIEAGVKGTVVDPGGGVIANAEVTLRRAATPGTRDLRTDGSGQFNIMGLEPGRYELQVIAPGFQRLIKDIDVQPAQIARADSTLSIGSVSETVEVSAAASVLSTQTSSLARKSTSVRPLPGKLPADETAVNGRIMLSTNSAGTLFRSTNSGRSWKTVKPVWQGKVVELSLTGAVFQLKTDKDSVWVSRDGNLWTAARADK